MFMIDYMIILFAFLLGLIIGSFLNCLIYRMHAHKDMGGRSFCPHCRHQIAWYDNIPLLSFVILRGHCRHCRKKISWQYPIVELITGFLFVLAYTSAAGIWPEAAVNIFSNTSMFGLRFTIPDLQFPIYDSRFSVLLLRNWFIVAVMIVIFIYDLKWYLILDKVTVPAMIVIFGLNLLLGYNLWNLLFSGIIGGSFFLFQFLVSRGKWIGGGDIRLGVLIGLTLGWPMVLAAIFVAYLIGSFAALVLVIFRKKRWGSMVPLGIFLSTATVIILFFGGNLINWYFSLFYL